MSKKIAYAGIVIHSFFSFFVERAYAEDFSGKLQVDPITPGIASLPEFIMTLLKIAVQIGIPIASIFLIWSGFLFLTAQGNEAQLTKAKSSFLWAVIGTAVLLSAWILATAIEGTIWNQIGGSQMGGV